MAGRKSCSTCKQEEGGCEHGLRARGLLRCRTHGTMGRKDAPPPVQAQSNGAVPGVDAALVFQDGMAQPEFKSGALEVSSVYRTHSSAIFSFLLKISFD